MNYEKFNNKKEEKPQDWTNIEYKNIEKPEYYIHGSYVLDKMFKKNFSYDLDVFIENEEDFEKIPEDLQAEEKDGKPVNIVIINGYGFFPPLLRPFNTSKYIYTEQGIVKPDSYPTIPTEIAYADNEHEEVRRCSFEEVVRGIKDSLRYGLPIEERTKSLWREFCTDFIHTDEFLGNYSFSKTETIERDDFLLSFLFESEDDMMACCDFEAPAILEVLEKDYGLKLNSESIKKAREEALRLGENKNRED